MNMVAGRTLLEIKSIAAGLVLCLFSAQILAGGTGPATRTAAPETRPTSTLIPTPPSASYQKGLAAYDAGDYAKARSIWLPLAEKGDVLAQRGMGKLYEKGRGVDRDFAEAIRWYRPAAEKGDAESQYRLAVGYGYGLGVTKDEATAMMWLRKAAEGGQKRAQKSLAKGYEEGLQGLPRDPAKAKYWYDRSNSGS
jgi:TPR repeat protein